MRGLKLYTVANSAKFGIELDEDTTGTEEPPQLKIEMPANRYDLLYV
jgi:hypothetical protein